MKTLLLGSLSTASLLGALAIVACSSTPTSVNGGGVDGGDEASSAEDGGAGEGSADAFAACKGVDFQTSGTFDVDLKAVHIRGRVTVDGAAASGSAVDVGRITFTSTALRGATSTAIATDASYETTLAPGTYDIGYQPDSTCSTITTAGAWPCNAHVLKQGVALSADGVFDLDLPTVVVSGAVTLKGQAFATQSSITFTEAGALSTVAAPTAAPQGYKIRLFKGTYAVGYAPRGGTSCGTTAPCNSGIIKPSVSLTTSGVLDVDVPMVVARGAVSLNGTPMSGDTRGGSVTFALASAKPVAAGLPVPSASISIAPDGTYAVGLLPETYNIGYAGVPGATATSLLPRNGGILRASTSIKTDGTLDLDVTTASVKGKVTLNGAAATSTSTARGSIFFTDTGSGSLASILADGTYATVVLAGTYDIGFTPSSSTSCLAEGAFPCNSAKLKSLALAKGSGVLDLDIKVVTVQGKMTLNGASLPAGGATPSVTFAPPVDPKDPAPKFATLTVPLTTGTSYSTRLIAGTYDVGYGGAPCTADTETMPLPCNSGTLRPAVSLVTTGALDVDVTSAVVSGRVTLAGKEPPSSTVQRGGLSFTGKSSGTAITAAFSPDGPIAYKAHLLRGRYVIMYLPGASCSTSDAASGDPSALPCVGVVLAGCD